MRTGNIHDDLRSLTAPLQRGAQFPIKRNFSKNQHISANFGRPFARSATAEADPIPTQPLRTPPTSIEVLLALSEKQALSAQANSPMTGYLEASNDGA
jgi:hypothetical protein